MMFYSVYSYQITHERKSKKFPVSTGKTPDLVKFVLMLVLIIAFVVIGVNC